MLIKGGNCLSIWFLVLLENFLTVDKDKCHKTSFTFDLWSVHQLKYVDFLQIYFQKQSKWPQTNVRTFSCMHYTTLKSFILLFIYILCIVILE